MRFSLLLLSLLALPVLAEGVWKWKDENGVVHYSDQPGPGAVRVDLHSQTFTPPNPQPTSSATNSKNASRQSTAPGYRSLDIWKPDNGATFPNAGGQVDVRIRIEPALGPADTLALYLDGKRVDSADNALDFTLTDVTRGAHNLVATVTNGSTGQVAIQSSPVAFFVQQTSVAQPPVGPNLKNPARPRG